MSWLSCHNQVLYYTNEGVIAHMQTPPPPCKPLSPPLICPAYYEKNCCSSVINRPAILAELSVLKIPVMSALTATLETSPDLAGEICESTPICVPREPMLPKPHRA